MRVAKLRAAALAAGLCLLAGCGAAVAAPASHAGRLPAICRQATITRSVVKGAQSLDKWAKANGDTVSDVLGLTFACGNGAKLDAYLDRGDLSAPMARGTVLWSLLPGGGA